MNNKKEHWENIYKTKDHKKVGWYQESPEISLELLSTINANPSQSIVDVGCGASVLVDNLISQGFKDITLLDLSQEALSSIEKRLGRKGNIPNYLTADITSPIELSKKVDVWHDRAVFHFLTDSQDREVYMRNLENNLSATGYAVIGTFSLNGPSSCSGLNIVQYDEQKMKIELPDSLELLESKVSVHVMPSGAEQEYMYFIIKKNA